MRLVEMSVAVGGMAILVLLIRVSGKRFISKTAIIWLWDLVLLRALLPVRITLKHIPIEKSNQGGLPAFFDTLNKTESFLNSADMGRKPMDTAFQIPNYAGSLEQSLTLVWFGGFLCMAVCFAVIYRKDYRKLRNISPVQNETAERLFRYKPVLRKIRLYESSYFNAPITFGVLRPKIVIPEEKDTISRVDLRNMVAHELVHIRRYDVAKRYLIAAVLCIHWFNPLVWVMYRMYLEDQEMACDEQVLRALGKQEAKNYIYTMIKMASRGSRLLPTNGFWGKDHGRRRILAAMNQKRMGKAGMLTAFAGSLCLLLFFCSFPSATSEGVSANVDETRQEEMTGLEGYEMEIESLSPTLEGRYEFPEVEISADFDYHAVMKDLEENYNDLSQPLTQEQELALRLQRLARMAMRYPEWYNMGDKLNGYAVWLKEEYGQYNK